MEFIRGRMLEMAEEGGLDYWGLTYAVSILFIIGSTLSNGFYSTLYFDAFLAVFSCLISFLAIFINGIFGTNELLSLQKGHLTG